MSESDSAGVVMSGCLLCSTVERLSRHYLSVSEFAGNLDNLLSANDDRQWQHTERERTLAIHRQLEVLPEKISADPSAEQILTLRQALHEIHQLTRVVN